MGDYLYATRNAHFTFIKMAKNRLWFFQSVDFSIVILLLPLFGQFYSRHFDRKSKH